MKHGGHRPMTLEDLSDERLARLSLHDSEPFGILFDRYAIKIYNFARFRGLQPSEAQDVTSDTFERALRALDRFDPLIASFSTWLFSIARNLTLDHLRANHRKGLTSIDDPVDFTSPDLDPEHELIEKQAADALLDSIRKLDARAQEILSLKFASRLSNKEIAEVTKLSESHVAVILFRSIRKLRTMLFQEEPSTHG